MGDMFRSEEMEMVQLFVDPQVVYEFVSKLGEAGLAQFRDLNENVNMFLRTYVNEVRKCDDMERKLKFIETEVKKHEISIPDIEELPTAPLPKELVDLEAHISKIDEEVRTFTDNLVTLKTTLLKNEEMKYVLEKSKLIFGEQQAYATKGDDSSNRERLDFVAGVMDRERLPGFERMLWRVSKGNALLRQADIEIPLENPATGHFNSRVVFIVFFQGDQLKSRIMKICSGYHASLHACPIESRQEEMEKANVRLADLTTVINQTNDHLHRVLGGVAKELQCWSVMVSKTKAIYHTLNLFSVDVSKKCIVGECWIPTSEREAVKSILNSTSSDGENISFMNTITTTDVPPTYNKTNKFTQGFQNLINAYGIASYREANPALYTIVTFPFLFAVMFGDVGHAIIIILFALALIIWEQKIMSMKNKGEIFNIFFSGRYIVLLMGIYSVYTGMIYNDIFSKSMNIFGSSWMYNGDESDYEPWFDIKDKDNATDLTGLIQYAPNETFKNTPYFMGVDPVWQGADNKIIFLNSYKMKLSIVFGVVHMLFGICVGIFNFVHFKKYYCIVLETLPQILLLCFLFLWMVVMMFMKWSMYSGEYDGKDTLRGSSCAPSVLIYFINMMLFSKTKQHDDCDIFMFEGQDIVQKVLVFGALLCIPVMLFGKPVYLKYVLKDTKNDEGEEEEFGELMIHQAIHTIEYVLSTVSHTASYLRLWALSLAHAQLSEVLWTMLFSMGLKVPFYYGVITIAALFLPWAIFTLGILVMMEGLSAFLHTLRLHWVEFMSKFYIGLGYPFEPFNFKALFSEEQEEG